MYFYHIYPFLKKLSLSIIKSRTKIDFKVGVMLVKVAFHASSKEL